MLVLGQDQGVIRKASGYLSDLLGKEGMKALAGTDVSAVHPGLMKT